MNEKDRKAEYNVKDEFEQLSNFKPVLAVVTGEGF